MLEPRHTAIMYRVDNGWVVELRQGNNTGKLVGSMASTGDVTPGKALDAILVAKQLEDANKPIEEDERPKRRQAKAALTPIPTFEDVLDNYLSGNGSN